MSKLISGKEAKLAWANGEQIQIAHLTMKDWDDLTDNYILSIFNSDSYIFRLKPRTISINGIEVPAPFKPKEGEDCCYLSDESTVGFHTISYNSARYAGMLFGLYRPSEIKQVVAALRQVFGEVP